MSKLFRVASGLSLLAVASCGGGGGSAGSSSQKSFQLESCTLGCGAGSCEVRQVNTNSDITFTFNDLVDASSVSFSQISLSNTVDGGSPTGRFLVDGNQITFRPSYVDTSEGVSFGFDESTEYTLNMFASPGESTVVKSSLGRPNTTPIRCTFVASGIQDFAAGPPVVTVYPSEDEPPTERDFEVELTFNDVVRSLQLVNTDGSSPTVDVSLVSVQGSSEVVYPFEGEFTFEVDIDNRQTKLTYTPGGLYPSGGNGKRFLRVTVSNQISDLVGNRLLNAGAFNIPLPEQAGLTGELNEDFTTTGQLDEDVSAPGLWLGAGALDSGLNPATGEHPGGGHGALGDLDMDDLTFNTGTGAIESELLGTTVIVNDGVFMASSASLTYGETASGIGSNPLRLYVRGSATIAGNLDCSGEDAPVNFGLYRPYDERLSFFNGHNGKPYPDPEMQDHMTDTDEADGGDGGVGHLAAGSGGQGGDTWYNYSGYYNDGLTGWFEQDDYVGGGSPPVADDNRFANGYGSELLSGVHGNNGGRVGGDAPSGHLLPASAAAEQDDDMNSGSGMGSVSWPPKSNVIPGGADVLAGTWHANTDGDVIKTHRLGTWSFLSFTHMRARGGGGGGYWTAGTRGDFHDAEDINFQDGFGGPLRDPDIDGNSGTINWDFNGLKGTGRDSTDEADRNGWQSYIYLDNLTGSHTIEDASGGFFDPSYFGAVEHFYTLDPADGYLRGGSGGGGGGSSQHGSYNDEWGGSASLLDIESYRGTDGSGGGAGGGAVQIRVANDLTVVGTVSVAGGDGADSAAQVSSAFHIDTKAYEYTRPGEAGGGGGSGGALLLQVGDELTLDVDSLFLDGGNGGIGGIGNHGGVGGAGVLRIDANAAPTLAEAATLVSPIESYDLGERTEFGTTGENSGSYVGAIPGTTGDMTVSKAVGTGSITFNGNSTGIGSEYYSVPSTILFAKFTDYEITCEWSDGSGGGGTITYSDSNPVTPGVTPIWAAFRTAYGFEEAGVIDVIEGSETDWVVPGYNTAGGGADELSDTPAQTRLIRYQIVFDQDLVQALIGSNPSATFQVTDVTLKWAEL